MFTFNPSPFSEVAEKELGKNVKGGVVAKLAQSMRSLSLRLVRLVIKDKAKHGDGKAISKAAMAAPEK